MEYKRITVLCGHYGSGKTNIAVNMALELKKRHECVTLADLDIVNPYFRSADSEKSLNEKGIRLIASDFVNTNVDVPALPPAMYTLCDDRKSYAVIDLGGDDRGALALGRIRDKILSENNYSMLFVLNCFRPLTRTAEDAVEVIREVEQSAGIKVTGLINNSNLGEETTAEDILQSDELAKKVSALSGVPIVLTCADERLFDGLNSVINNLFPLNLQEKYF